MRTCKRPWLPGEGAGIWPNGDSEVVTNDFGAGKGVDDVEVQGDGGSNGVDGGTLYIRSTDSI